MIAGTSYEYGFASQCNGGTEQPTSMDFLVPAGSKALVGVVGITDNSPYTRGKFTFSVLAVDGTALARNTLGYGQQWALHVSVVGEVRIRLQILNSGGFLKDWVYPAWADMKFAY
jgi:hypothetical protein